MKSFCSIIFLVLSYVKGEMMKVTCNICNSKARIYARETISNDFARLKCQCTNNDCGHRFVSLLTFSHTTCPPAEQLQRALIESAVHAIKQLPLKDKQAIVTNLMS